MTQAIDAPLGGACLLADRAPLVAGGEDATSFLHGQLSNDVSRLGASQARLAAYCDAKGRMLASFIYARCPDRRVVLVCQADVLETTLKRLRMFVMRAQVKIEDGRDRLRCVGLVGDAAALAVHPGAADLPPWGKIDLADDTLLLRLPQAAGPSRWMWIGPSAEAESLLASQPSVRLQDWDWLEVTSGVAQVRAATAGTFVPQMLNYELVGGVDFKKGCYPGQEVVAGSQYLGKLKRRSVLLTSPQALSAGEPVFWSQEPHQPAGHVAQSSEAADGSHAALVELKIAALEAGDLHAGSAEGPQLTLGTLPYPLPHEAPPT